MTNAGALRHDAAHDGATSGHVLESLGVGALFGVAAFTQLSIAMAQALLFVAIACWGALIVVRRERVEVPVFFYPLIAYAGWTLLSAAFSLDPRASFADCKQLALFLVVPATYRLVQGSRASTMLTVIMSVGAATAAYGIFQYGLLHYDQLNQRPQGTLGHYMTYSGLLMLVIGTALAKLLFDPTDKAWPALVMPALLLAVALTSTRMAWVGVCAAAAVLLIIKDFRLLAILPIVGAITFAAAGPAVTQRLMSMFDARDPTRRDRVAMILEGQHMVRDYPVFGVGPNMVEEVYARYRVPEAVEQLNPHLHNVPMQIAAERGLPALLIWLGFLAVLCRDLYRQLRSSRPRTEAAAGIAAVAGMLAAGLFEYNFGDSEFLMLFLLLITLPFTAARSAPADTAHA
ncbi:MAG TPA: O-antigen ligase family protein [Vicinamibacterales bacterium]|nr:O-antigen ligase family protein [Vicinamibacterales bacterium]